MKNWVLPYKDYLRLFLMTSIAFVCFRLVLGEEVINILHNPCCYDTRSYLMSCKTFVYSIYSGDFLADAYRPMGVAMLYGIPLLWKATDNDLMLLWAPIINFILYYGIAVLLFTLIKNYIGRKGAIWAVVLLIFSVATGIYAQFLMSEIWFVFVMLLSVLMFFKYDRSRKGKWLFIGLFLLCFMVLIRPGSKYILLAVFIYYLPDVWRDIKSKFIVLFILGLGIIGLQFMMVKNTTGKAVLTYIDTKTIHNYFLAQYDAVKSNKNWQEHNVTRYNELKEVPLKEQKDVVFTALGQSVKEDPLALVQAFSRNMMHNSFSGNKALYEMKNYDSNFFLRSLNTLATFQNILLSIGAIVLVFMILVWHLKKNTSFQKSEMLVALLPIYFIVVSGISYNQGDRMHMVFYTLVLLTSCILLKKRTNSNSDVI